MHKIASTSLTIVVACTVVGGAVRAATSSGQATPLVRLQASTPGIAQTGHINISGTEIAAAFSGDGSALTGLNATNLAAGTINDSRIPNNIVRTGQAQTISGNKTFSGVDTFTNASAPFVVTSSNVVTNLNADLLDGMHASSFLTGIPNPLNLSGAAGGAETIHGTNNDSAGGSIGVRGSAMATSGVVSGVYGETTSTLGRAVFGTALATSGNTFGGQFESYSTSGVGGYGFAGAASGTTYGLIGKSASPTGYGVFGEAYSGSGLTIGVMGQSASSNGLGVYGNNIGGGAGVYGSGAAAGGVFQCTGTGGYGVIGQTQTNTGALAGGYFRGTTGAIGEGDSASGLVYGIRGINSSPDGFAGHFTSSNDGIALHGESTFLAVEGISLNSSGSAFGGKFTTASSSGTGVYGTATSASGITYGVYGLASSLSGFGGYFKNSNGLGTALAGEGGILGVYGISYDATSGTGGYFDGPRWGVRGTSAAGGGYGGFFDCANSAGVGVRGLGNAYGGRFEANTATGIGVYGTTFTSSGAGYGVYGETASTTGTAVFGVATPSTGVNYGVYGKNSSAAGYAGFFKNFGTGVGIQVESGSHDAIRATTPAANHSAIYAWNTATSGTAYGVYGSSDSATAGWGVYSQGRLGATGTKLFRIDHPRDPENMYLQHYCSEGPEPLNVYTGNVVTDSKGMATIQLPDYFEDINRDPRYSLTVIDDTEGPGFVQVKVAKKIRNGVFKIMTSAPNIEVSWRVEGIRNDRWVQKYGAPVEVQKEGIERGTYQHPELYCKGPEFGMAAKWSTPGQKTTSREGPAPRG